VKDRSLDRFDLRQVHHRSVKVAMIARDLAPAVGDIAFTAALLADAGMLVLALGVPEECAIVWDRAAAEKRPRHELERELWGIDHTAVGAYLLALWGLPEPIIDAVAHHHAARDSAHPTSPWEPVSAAVRVATALVCGETPDPGLIALLGAEDRLATLQKRGPS
jgi:HD-like signal output (HDOD) protein